MKWFVCRATVSSSFQKARALKNILVVFYWKLHMGKKDTIFGVKYQNILLSIKILNYKDNFVETPIYIRCVVITIVTFTYMLAIELFTLHNLLHFMDVFLSTYLYFSLYRFVEYP